MAFQAQQISALPMPTDDRMAASWEPLARAIRRVSRGAHSPSAALAAAQTDFEVLTAPPPKPTNPTPYILVALVLVLAGLGFIARQAWSLRAAIREQAYAYAWVGPAALSMMALVILPFTVGAAVSLFAHDDGQWTFVGFTHFWDILLARDWPITSALSFWFTLVVTVGWTLANVIAHVAIGMALAMVLRSPS